ncbi:MAG: YihA family ribosome biogenesis GTP-binding protein [Hyphomicrobiales bacterium]|nr:YihA family ribosome biogenesis GTP-binding protein [Hyphomicrobiales bacterium]
MPEPSSALEAARKLFAQAWSFASEIRSAADVPSSEAIEVAFAGRSNVGKSSLINALTGQKSLARTSNTPGRTQGLIFFTGPPGLTLVDMPGYGYAAAPKKTVAAWTGLIRDYLRGRVNLRRVFLLIDARHGVKANDEAVMKLMDEAAVTYQIVLTKADKPKAGELEKVIAATQAAIAKRPAAFPEILATSSVTGAGMDELRAVIAGLG